jgi:hypothetical protein
MPPSFAAPSLILAFGGRDAVPGTDGRGVPGDAAYRTLGYRLAERGCIWLRRSAAQMPVG